MKRASTTNVTAIIKLSQIIISLFAVIVIICSACSTRPRHVLNEKKMIDVLQDMYIADAIIRNKKEDYKSDFQKDAIINGVLEKHYITQAELDSSLSWYAENIEVYSVIQDTISARLQRQSDAIGVQVDRKYAYSLTGFNDVLPEHYTLDTNNPTFRFNMDSNTIKRFDIEHFKFCFTTRGVDTLYHRLEAAMYYKYKDTVIVDRKIIKIDSDCKFIKPRIADSLLISLSGYVHMIMATQSMPKILLEKIKNKEIISVLTDSTDIADKSVTDVFFNINTDSTSTDSRLDIADRSK